MQNLILTKKLKSQVFQVLLLDNDAGEDVKVQEATQVNFFKVKEHLRNGGSVFITSKDTQKLFILKPKRNRTITDQEEVMEPFSDNI